MLPYVNGETHMPLTTYINIGIIIVILAWILYLAHLFGKI